MSSDENSSKRTRASGEVLDFLLQEFDRNHNPTPDQRKEISERTGMAEKAVRIWFQNRRAKLRKVERMSSSSSIPVKKAGSHHSSRSNSFGHDERPFTSAANGAHSGNTGNGGNNGTIPIEVNDTYCFIDCSSLLVGSWQRIKSGVHDEQALRTKFVNLSPFTLNTVMNSVDLLVILSKKNLEINYFFLAVLNHSKILFRIFYPISSIVSTSLLDNNIHKESNELRLSFAHQPKFSVYFFNGVNANANQWSICDDFSEGHQVSLAHMNEGGTLTPHVLVGVKTSLQYLNAHFAGSTTALVTAHPPVKHASSGLSGFSPLANFDAAASPNSLASAGSHFQKDIYMHMSHHSAHKDYEEMFNSANTPDFLANLDGDHDPAKPKSSDSTSNSPSLNSIANTNPVHAYTHQHQNGHNPAYELLGGPEFHHHSDFDYNGATDYGALNEDSSLNPLDNGENASERGNNGGSGGSGTGTGGNVDSFIDFG
ncbi:homeobox-domain-containing protein, partial [Suhomyces tanzawaensis NRRL Y-17324]